MCFRGTKIEAGQLGAKNGGGGGDALRVLPYKGSRHKCESRGGAWRRNPAAVVTLETVRVDENSPQSQCRDSETETTTAESPAFHPQAFTKKAPLQPPGPSAVAPAGTADQAADPAPCPAAQTGTVDPWVQSATTPAAAALLTRPPLCAWAVLTYHIRFPLKAIWFTLNPMDKKHFI